MLFHPPTWVWASWPTRWLHPSLNSSISRPRFAAVINYYIGYTKSICTTMNAQWMVCFALLCSIRPCAENWADEGAFFWRCVCRIGRDLPYGKSNPTHQWPTWKAPWGQAKGQHNQTLYNWKWVRSLVYLRMAAAALLDLRLSSRPALQFFIYL